MLSTSSFAVPMAKGGVRLINANALKPGQVFSDRCWISEVSDQILSDLKACIGLRLVEMPAEGRKGLNGGEIPKR